MPSTSTALSNDTQLARNAIYTPYYGLVHLGLATLAYTDAGIWKEAALIKQLKAAVSALPQLPAAPPPASQPTLSGTWAVEWGPCFDLDYSNVMYGATYRDANNAAVFAAVVIRGTDVNVVGPGFIAQLIQDLDGAHPVTMSMPQSTLPTPTLTIAKGTNDGLNRLLGFTPNKLWGAAGSGSVTDWVQSIYQADPTTPIVVTGHSLGGCLTTVMSTYLYYYLANVAGQPVTTIVPTPYAPPTAGLTDFATNFNTIFPKATLWMNSLDVVPNAFQQTSNPNPTVPLYLQNIQGFWDVNPPGLPPTKCLDTKRLSPAAMIEYVINNYPTTYTHPKVGAQVMTGFVWAPPGPPAKCSNDWITQLMIQHFPPMYHRLMTEQQAVTLAGPFPLPATTTHPNVCVLVPQNVPA